jgi:hypothetical protein
LRAIASRAIVIVRLIALYLVAEGSGVIVKLAGEGQLDPVTGQITVVFKGNPEGDPPLATGLHPLPFSLLNVQLTGRPRASLVNARSCGRALTTSLLTPYSGDTPVTPASEFTLAPCFDYGFSPTFSAEMTGSGQAGAYSPFLVTFARTDRGQELGAITVRTPPGLLGMVSHVTQCAEPLANAGTCPQAFEIGTVTAGVGAGPDPYDVTGGRAYLTGPYKGARPSDSASSCQRSRARSRWTSRSFPRRSALAAARDADAPTPLPAARSRADDAPWLASSPSLAADTAKRFQ